MQPILLDDDMVSEENVNNLEKLQNSVTCEMAKVIDWLTANKLSLNILIYIDIYIFFKPVSQTHMLSQIPFK